MQNLLFCLLIALPLLLAGQSAEPAFQTLYTGTVYFDFGQHALRPDADETLQQAVAEVAAQDRPDVSVRLTAHTDAVGSDDNNDVLASRRAEAVRSALIAQGMNAERIQSTAFGRRLPVADNDTDEGRQLNRRVTIELLLPIAQSAFSGRVTDPTSGEGIEAQLIVKAEGYEDSLQADPQGNFKFMVPPGTAFDLTVFAPGYFFETLSLQANEPSINLQDIKLPPAKAGEAVDIRNLYFVGNQPVLLDRSLPELPKLLRFLQLNPDMKIEIAGHINRPNTMPVTKETTHFKLSENRAKTVYDYLIENGIPASQVSYKGYGNSEMRYPTARTEREQELNRRVEIRILGTGKKLGTIGEDGY